MQVLFLQRATLSLNLTQCKICPSSARLTQFLNIRSLPYATSPEKMLNLTTQTKKFGINKNKKSDLWYDAKVKAYPISIT